MDQNLSAAGGPSLDQPAIVAPPRALKIAVIVMGIILIIGFTAVFITIGYRVANPRPPAPPGPSFATEVAIPAGAEIAGLEIQGDRALVTVRSGDGDYMVIVLDTAKGEAIGRFILGPE